MPESENQALFTSQSSVAGVIERLLLEARVSVDAAMYLITNPRLARALGQARDRGLRVRLLVDGNKLDGRIRRAEFRSSADSQGSKAGTGLSTGV